VHFLIKYIKAFMG